MIVRNWTVTLMNQNLKKKPKYTSYQYSNRPQKMKSEAYLSYMLSSPLKVCPITGKKGNFVDLHHEGLTVWFNKSQKKRCDYTVIPLESVLHHEQRHYGKFGMKTFWEHFNVNPFPIVLHQLETYLETEPEDKNEVILAIDLIKDYRDFYFSDWKEVFNV